VQERPDHLVSGPDDEPRPRRVPVRAAGALLVAGTVAALLTSAPWSSTPAAPHPPDRPQQTAGLLRPQALPIDPAAMRKRGQAVQSRYAMIRAVPSAYRKAADRASAAGGRRTPPEFFLALAFNRTLYGLMLEGDTGRAFAYRGPVQWDLADFHRYAVPGHTDAAVPLDAFLAIGSALDQVAPGGFSDAFSAARALGSSPDHARAADETYAILSTARRTG
jgi:hypothetical protein